MIHLCALRVILQLPPPSSHQILDQPDEQETQTQDPEHDSLHGRNAELIPSAEQTGAICAPDIPKDPTGTVDHASAQEQPPPSVPSTLPGLLSGSSLPRPHLRPQPGCQKRALEGHTDRVDSMSQEATPQKQVSADFDIGQRFVLGANQLLISSVSAGQV